MKTKTQRAKAFYDQLREDGSIGINFTGLIGDIWVTSDRKAYKTRDLGKMHLSNIKYRMLTHKKEEK